MAKIIDIDTSDLIPPWEQKEIDDARRIQELQEQCLLKQERNNEHGDISDFSYFNKNHYKQISQAFRLQNKEYYQPAIIAISYSLIGLALRKHTFSMGEEEMDTRLSYVYSLRSGNGKKPLSKVIIHMAKVMEYKYSKLTSLHAEQLIGKKVIEYIGKGNNKKRNVSEIQGYFRDDIIVVDDALPLLTKGEFEITRNYFIQAWDTIGDNEVTKKTVDLRKEEALLYCPEFVSHMFIQDKPVEREIIDTGMGRKSPILYMEVPGTDDQSYYLRVSSKDSIKYEYMINIVNKAKNANEIIWNFLDDTERLIAKKTNELKVYFENQGSKGKEYASIMHWTIQNYIYKYAAILSASFALLRSREIDRHSLNIKVTPEMATAAIEDLKIVLLANYKYWNNYVIFGTSHLSRSEKIIIDALVEKKAFSKETANIGNPAFLAELAEKHGKSYSTFNNSLRKLKEKGFVEAETIGKAEKGKENSCMWLKS